MSAISKFSYLRELLDDQPKKNITVLPFSEKGYNRAIEILKKKYGNTSEIIQAHGRQILKLPTITTVKDAVQSDLRMCTKEPSFYYTNSLFRFLFHFMVLQSLIVVS